MRKLDEGRMPKARIMLGLLLSAWTGAALAHHVIVETDYVLKNKDRAGVVLLDARGAGDTRKGVIPGATALGDKPAAVALRDVDARIWPVAKLEKALGEAGITREQEIIVYAAKGDTASSVPFWILEYLGADKVKLYNGGIDDWVAGKHPLTNEIKKLPAAKFVAKVRADRLATTDYVKQNLNKKETQFLDSRTVKENAGEDIRSVRGGHIAAANHTNIPYEYGWVDPEAASKLAEKKVSDRNGMAIKDGSSLKDLYKGLDPKKEVVAYCQTGTRSTQSYAVLRELGYEKVRNYDDSWIVYGANPDLPAKNASYYDFVKVNAALRRLDALEKRLDGIAPVKK